MSANIIIHNDPEGINKRIIHSVDNGVNLLSWMVIKYGENGFNVPTKIFLGDAKDGNEIDQDSYQEINRTLKADDIINIVHRPQGTELIVAVIVAIVASVVLAPDISPPPQVENPNFPKTNESPNNRLSGQTNLARPLGRIPDIYGRMRVYPDLGAKTVSEFIGQVKFITEYLIIGRGEYDLEDIKSGETLISEITGSDFTIFNPNDLIPELLDVTESNEINGQEVKAPNDTSLFSASAENITFISSNSTFQNPPESDESGLAAFEGLLIGTKFDVAGTLNNNTTLTFKSFSKSSNDPKPPNFNAFTTYTIGVDEALTDEVVATTVLFDEAPETAPGVVGPFIVTGGTQEVWFDIIASRGLADRRDSAIVSVTIDFDLILDLIDSLGNIINTETTRVSIVDNTLDQRFYTFKVIPASPGSIYQASVQRLTNTVNDAAFYDTTKWTRLAGVDILTNFDQGNVTSIVLTTQATDQATQAQERKFNSIVTRKLRTYTTAGGVIIPALTATTKFADALLEHMTNSFIGNKPTSDIDLDELYTIQEALDVDPIYGSVLGRFSYSFSGERSSVKDELLTIANACRVFIKKNGNRLEFSRDEIQSVRTTLFNTRNKKPKSEQKSIRFQKPNDNDGVEIQWTFEDTGEGFTEEFNDGVSLNPKKIDAAGIRNFKQAWNRGFIEFNKLKLQRESVRFESTKEGLLSQVGDRVANADGTDIKAQSGEVKSLATLTVETYTAIDFDGNANATVILRDESGVASTEITVTPRLDGISGFILAGLPAFTIRIRGDLDYQVGTLYTFALTGEQKIRDYILQKRTPKTNGYVGLELLNYDPDIYAPDTLTPPTHETTLICVTLDPVASGNLVEEPTVALSTAAVETLAWDLAATGTYLAESNVSIGLLQFAVDISGNWNVTSSGNVQSDTDSGDYRPKVIGDDPDNYEIKVTRLVNSGMGTVFPVGGAVFGSFVPLNGGEGISVVQSSAGTTNVSVTIEVREIATPANTTGLASFVFDATKS
jgi:hypothetical protein